MPLRLFAMTLDAQDPVRLGRFWGGMFGREAIEHAEGVLLPSDYTQLGLRFVACSEPKTRPNLAHIHLTSDSAFDQQNTVAKALDLGASHLEFGQKPEDGHIVLADPEGNEFCVIEPDNNYLAGTGFFGEVACDGPRTVGLFWQEAVDWSLVWDQGQETAIQCPDGGTKVSWGGEPAAAAEIRRRHRPYLIANKDLAHEIDRLVSLGATLIGSKGGGTILLADPGGNDFEVARQDFE